LPEADPAAVFVVAQRAAAIAQPTAPARPPTVPPTGPVELVIRTGTATFPEDGANAGELITVARERLRGARAVGPPGDRKSQDNLPTLGTDVVVIDPLMKQVFKLAKRAAPAAISVLVVGETGTGKEVVAETIHRLSPRAAAPFVKLNCAALS